MVDQLDRANRVANAISSARLNTLATNVQLLSDALTSLRITLGQLVSNELNSVVNFLKQLVVGLKDLIELNKAEVAVAARGLVALLGVISAVGTSLFTLGAGAAFAAAPLIAVGAALAAFNALVASATALVPIFFSFGAAFVFVAGAASLFTAVIFGAFTTAIALLSSLTASIAVAPSAWGNFFQELTTKIKDFFNNVIVPIYNGFISRTEQITKSTEILLKSVGDLFDPTMFESGNWEGFGKLLALIVETMLEFTAVVIRDLTPSIKTIADALTKLSSALFVASFGFDKNKDSLVKLLSVLNKFPFTDLVFLQTPIEPLNFGLSRLFNSAPDKKERKEDPNKAKRVEELTKKFNEQRNAIALVSSTASNYATELSKVASIFNDLGGAKAVEFSKFIKTDLSQATRQKKLQEIKAQLDFLNEFKKSAKGVVSLTETNERIKELEEAKKAIEQVGKQIDSVNDMISGKSLAEIQKSIAEGLAFESDKIKNLNSLIDQITNMENMRAFGGVINPNDIEKVRVELSNILGVAVQLDKENPIQSLVAALRSSIPDAQKASQAQIKIYQDLLRILPDLEGLDLNKQEDREKFARSFAQLSEQQEKLKEIADLEESRLDFERQLRRSQMTAHEQRMDDLQEELKKRQEIFQQLINARQAEIATIQGDLNIARAEGDAGKIASLETQLAQAQASLDAARRSKGSSFLDFLDQTGKENKKRNEEAVKAREDAEMTIMEMRLENEEDVQKRIELRQAIAAKKRKNQLEADIKDLEEKLNTAEDKAELDRLKGELEEASRVAGAAEADKIVQEETKDKDKDMNKVVDKRLDLESELLSTLGKQVTTLQQMAALMQFIEALQRRKDRRALQDLREISKVREKIARADKMAALGGEKGEKGLAAGQRFREELALLMGIQQRNMGMAGVPQVVLNPNAMVNELIIAIRDLTNAIKDFRIGDMAAGIIPNGLNIGAGNRLVGANFGTINHIDNSNKTINIKTDNPDLAKALAGMKV